MSSKKDKPTGPQAEGIAQAAQHQQELDKLRSKNEGHQGAGQPGLGNQGGGGHAAQHGSGGHMSTQGGGSHSAERGEKHPQRGKGN